jgi:hypothetical protein
VTIVTNYQVFSSPFGLEAPGIVTNEDAIGESKYRAIENFQRTQQAASAENFLSPA